jgi:hypothetical protein
MPDMFREIREPGTGWILCRFDPDRMLLEFQRRKVRTLVDLTQYLPDDTEEVDNTTDRARISTY